MQCYLIYSFRALISISLGDSLKQLSNEQNPGCLGYIGDYTTQVHRDYSINHYKYYKDPG